MFCGYQVAHRSDEGCFGGACPGGKGKEAGLLSFTMEELVCICSSLLCIYILNYCMLQALYERAKEEMYSGVKTGRIWAYRNNISSFARSTALSWSERDIPRY